MARIIKPTRIIKHLKYLKPMKLYKLARDTGKNMISCDLGEGKTGIILHLHGSLKVLPFRSSDPLKEPFLVLRHDQMNPVQIATKLSELADHYGAVGFYMGFPADSCYMQNPNNGRGVKEALFDIDQTRILAGKIITFVNEKNSSKKALRKLKEYNPNLRKSYLKQFFQREGKPSILKRLGTYVMKTVEELLAESKSENGYAIMVEEDREIGSCGQFLPEYGESELGAEYQNDKDIPMELLDDKGLENGNNMGEEVSNGSLAKFETEHRNGQNGEAKDTSAGLDSEPNKKTHVLEGLQF
ncbi:hypothetical protein LWI28_000409 [Acer negundo]|uniref:Uncharacterized protein n=1 Tax=Acer negundo TaxID=4023 RepID=A0AAD5IWT3_ACENE|nr:hypothetical protein LWI28_000409 [Acer negundo]